MLRPRWRDYLRTIYWLLLVLLLLVGRFESVQIINRNVKNDEALSRGSGWGNSFEIFRRTGNILVKIENKWISNSSGGIIIKRWKNISKFRDNFRNSQAIRTCRNSKDAKVEKFRVRLLMFSSKRVTFRRVVALLNEISDETSRGTRAGCS